MEYEEDDDISFAKWMSSFWGHSLIDENEKEGRSYRKRQTQALSERRASLPAKLSSIHMTRLHASTKTPSSGHLRGCKEFQEGQDVKCHCHTKACKISSPDGSGSTSRSNAIQEFSESFEKQLHFKIKRSVSLDEDSDPCVICHDDLETGSIIELHCMHSFHKECIEKWLLKKPTCPTCRIHVLMSKSILDIHQPG
ncbi:leukemia NUP98 fusion partner 1 isoform X3 [Gopherus evgoodei]|uniref:leukemia NUP98 fusion partner 1 isoform X3 n=1 Tax=Gopherus evgoodei TaxID=1825980 RepID=UPI0011D015F5|nr:leukemia NUP98 fusion partner 1 isoform X3 [Gopherus evgoodei]